MNGTYSVKFGCEKWSEENRLICVRNHIQHTLCKAYIIFIYKKRETRKLQQQKNEVKEYFQVEKAIVCIFCEGIFEYISSKSEKKKQQTKYFRVKFTACERERNCVIIN